MIPSEQIAVWDLLSPDVQGLRVKWGLHSVLINYIVKNVGTS